MSDTPETDAALCVLPPEPGWPEGRKATCHHDFVVTEHFARRLERERDAAEDAAVGAMEECRKLKAINAELVESMLPLLSCLPLATCADFHHRKEDRHGYNEHCPVRRRYESGIEKCKSALTKAKGAK